MNHKAKILIVDDEEVVRHSFSRILGSTNCHVKAVASGTQVAPAMQEDQFDVVLLDLRMPEMDGMTVLRALKKHWPESEVIIITGYPTLESAKEAVALGAYDYLTKPVGPEQVIEASTSAMQHKRWALHSDTGSTPNDNGDKAGTAGLPNQPDFSRTAS